jgi:hypothetical protein
MRGQVSEQIVAGCPLILSALLLRRVVTGLRSWAYAPKREVIILLDQVGH